MSLFNKCSNPVLSGELEIHCKSSELAQADLKEGFVLKGHGVIKADKKGSFMLISSSQRKIRNLLGVVSYLQVLMI